MIKVENIIWTNNALSKLKKHGISEAQALDSFHGGQQEKADAGGRWNSIKKYPGFEIGVNYDRKPDGRWVIVSVWKRQRR